MGNKWTEEVKILDFKENPLQYFEPGSPPTYCVSLGKTLTLQRRTFANVKNPRFESVSCPVQETSQISLLPSAQEMLEYPEVIKVESYIQEIISQNATQILTILDPTISDQYLELIHGRYFGLSVRNEVKCLIESHTELQVLRLLSCGRKRINHEILHIHNAKVHTAQHGAKLTRRQMFTAQAIITEIFRYSGVKSN